MSEWLAMGGHGLYVWGSVAAAFVTVAWNIISARAEMRCAKDELTEIWDENDGA